MENDFSQILIDDTNYQTTLNAKFQRRKPYKNPDSRKIYAFIPGTIKQVFVSNGQTVKKGAPLLILEAMKMKNNVVSSIDGKVKKVYVQVDQKVANKELLVELE